MEVLMNKMLKTAAAALLSVSALAACTSPKTSSAPASEQASSVPESSAQASSEEEVGMANPWKETTDLDEAVKGSGVEFVPPVEEALPETEYEMNFFKYRYMDGVISAVYENINDELVIRKSNKYSGKEELAGIYNTYSKTWEHSLKGGINVTCEGDGTLISVATFTAGNGYSYSITFDPNEEDRGLTIDQINSLVQGMQ